MQQLTQTIDPKAMTLADWLAIARSIDFQAFWAYKQWIENANQESISALGISEWKKIAQAIGQSDSWAFYRYQEFNSEA